MADSPFVGKGYTATSGATDIATTMQDAEHGGDCSRWFGQPTHGREVRYSTSVAVIPKSGHRVGAEVWPSI